MDTGSAVSCLNILGGLLYLPPDDESLAPVFKVFADRRWVFAWPCGSREELAAVDGLIRREPHEPADLEPAFNELFRGAADMKAPPWASVYMDNRRAAFGESTLKLRAFLDEQGLGLNHTPDEPEDHIGLLLLTAAWLGVAKREKALNQLLQEHILPWAPTYLNLLKTVAPHPFYQGIAELAAITLKALQESREIAVNGAPVYQ
jgi:TorA maturation chaperone TorD